MPTTNQPWCAVIGCLPNALCNNYWQSVYYSVVGETNSVGCRATENGVRENQMSPKGRQSQSHRSQSFTPQNRGRQSLYGPKDLTHLVSRSLEWRSISSKEKEKLGLVTEDDGEFW